MLKTQLIKDISTPVVAKENPKHKANKASAISCNINIFNGRNQREKEVEGEIPSSQCLVEQALRPFSFDFFSTRIGRRKLSKYIQTTKSCVRANDLFFLTRMMIIKFDIDLNFSCSLLLFHIFFSTVTWKAQLLIGDICR